MYNMNIVYTINIRKYVFKKKNIIFTLLLILVLNMLKKTIFTSQKTSFEIPIR